MSLRWLSTQTSDFLLGPPTTVLARWHAYITKLGWPAKKTFDILAPSCWGGRPQPSTLSRTTDEVITRTCMLHNIGTTRHLWQISTRLQRQRRQRAGQASKRSIGQANLPILNIWLHWRSQLWGTGPRHFQQYLFSSLKSRTKSITAISVWFFIPHSLENVWNWQRQAFYDAI